ncbi:hypothetical protein C7374_11414 [Falsochrobactrum ovis]|uniref:Uncharacterized protein n=1 Tax=Falsochrobactrum ovis TaxID=1293442 RepID=A0A364JT25_9HYPH|nr:hypothetical protein C7374_11414 [Falsochrobactrum ovis]
MGAPYMGYGPEVAHLRVEKGWGGEGIVGYTRTLAALRFTQLAPRYRALLAFHCRTYLPRTCQPAVHAKQFYKN